MKLRRAPLAIAFVVLTALVAACGGDSGTGPSTPATPAGDYALSSVNGKPLPYRAYADTLYSVDFTQGGIAMRTDGSFSATMRVEERVENHLSVYADTTTGKWAVSGNTVTFTATDSSRTTGTISAASITLVDSTGAAPLKYVYSKK